VTIIESNTVMDDLEGLDHISHIGRLSVTNSLSLTSLEGLDTSVNIDEMHLSNIGLTNLSGLEGITQIDELEITNNSSLVDLQGLSNLGFVKSCIISNNPELATFSGLVNLTMIEDEMIITNNPKLTSIIDLGAITIIPSIGIQISNNTILSLCAASGLCALTNLDPALVDVSNNAPLCMTTADIETICGCPTAEAYFQDNDGDGYGDNTDPSVTYCPGSVPANHVTNNFDCSDMNPNDETLVLTGTISTSGDHRGILTLSSSSYLDSSADILFQAGTSIDLNEDFEVELGTILEAQIDSCGTFGQ